MLPRNTSVIVDTETGGLQPRINPLLSIGLLLGTPIETYSELFISCKPPPHTWLEIPIFEDQLKGKFSKTCEWWLNLTTGERTKPLPDKPKSFITAVAAELTGFVRASEAVPGWDIQSYETWGTHSYEEAASAIIDWLEKNKSLNPQTVIAHNASFDHEFITNWLPEILLVLPLNWECTMSAYKSKFLGGKTKGSSLGAICKLAHYQPQSEDGFHTALGDCRATRFIWGWLTSQGA